MATAKILKKSIIPDHVRWCLMIVLLSDGGGIICASLEIELILHIDSIFDEIAAKSWEAFTREPIRRAPTAPVGDIRVVDDETVIVGPVESCS